MKHVYTEFWLDVLRVGLLSIIIWCAYRTGYTVGWTEKRIRDDRQALAEMVYGFGIVAGCQNELGVCRKIR